MTVQCYYARLGAGSFGFEIAAQEARQWPPDACSPPQELGTQIRTCLILRRILKRIDIAIDMAISTSCYKYAEEHCEATVL